MTYSTTSIHSHLVACALSSADVPLLTVCPQDTLLFLPSHDRMLQHGMTPGPKSRLDKQPIWWGTLEAIGQNSSMWRSLAHLHGTWDRRGPPKSEAPINIATLCLAASNMEFRGNN